MKCKRELSGSFFIAGFKNAEQLQLPWFHAGHYFTGEEN